jgi:hypothetical protein
MRSPATAFRQGAGLLWALLSLAALFVLCAALADTTAAAAEPAPASTGPGGCPGNALANGDFRLGSTGWYTSTTGTGWKKNPLIVCSPSICRADCCAAFGSEGVWETVAQTVTIPARGVLNYWWQMRTSEPEPKPYDRLTVDLYAPSGARVASLAHHDSAAEERPWAQDLVDLSAYAGQTLELRFSAANDNHWATSFYVDDVCLQAGSPPRVPEASSLLLLGLGATGLATYIRLQARSRRGRRGRDHEGR